jgi:hypothetical protein
MVLYIFTAAAVPVVTAWTLGATFPSEKEPIITASKIVMTSAREASPDTTYLDPCQKERP